MSTLSSVDRDLRENCLSEAIRAHTELVMGTTVLETAAAFEDYVRNGAKKTDD